MTPRIGTETEHKTLVLLELLAVPVAVLVTFVTLALAELVAAVAGIANDAVEGGETVLDVGTAVIGFGTLLVLVAGGGLLVVGYRYCFESWFEDVSLPLVVLVPAIGIVVPIGYVIADTGTLQLSSWPLFVVVVSAYALAYRTIAIDSLREDRGHTSFVVGSLTALPAVVVLVDYAVGVFGSGRPITGTLEPIVAGTGTPMVRFTLVAVPLLVTALFAAGSFYGTQPRWDGPDWSIARLRNSIGALASRDRSDPSGGQPTGAGGGRVSSASSRSGGRSATSNAPSASKKRSTTANEIVPSSPGSPATRRDGARSDDDDSQASDERAADASTDDDRSASTTDGSAGDDRSASDQRGGASEDDASSAERTSATDGSSADGTGSDTRIFVDDFDQYVPDETSVATCPECEKEMPSDGVYNFCPFCGGEL